MGLRLAIRPGPRAEHCRGPSTERRLSAGTARGPKPRAEAGHWASETDQRPKVTEATVKPKIKVAELQVGSGGGRFNGGQITVMLLTAIVPLKPIAAIRRTVICPRGHD